MPPISLGIGLSLSMQGRGGTRFGARSPAGYLLDHLGSEPSGFAVDFVAMDCLARGGPSPYSGDPNGKLTYTAPSTKWITNRHGVLSGGTTLRCDHDASTLDTSATTHDSLGVGNGGVVRKTLTTSGAVTYVAGQDIVASDASDIAKWMAGRVVSYAGGSLVVDFRAASGYFTCSSWKIIVALGLLVEEQRTNLLLNSASLATQNVTVSAVAYTLSFFGTGTVTLSGVSTAGPLVGTGASNRVSLTFTPTAGTLTLTVSGSVTAAQLEAGSFPTSYIPTTSAQVTRAADNISLLTSAFPYDATKGTLIAEFSNLSANTTMGIAELADASTNYIALYRDTSFYRYRTSAANLNLNGAQFNGAGVFNKYAAVYAASNYVAAVNGNAIQTNGTTGLIPAATSLRIAGASKLAGAGSLNGHIKSLVYLPRRVSNASLPGISAL